MYVRQYPVEYSVQVSYRAAMVGPYSGDLQLTG